MSYLTAHYKWNVCLPRNPKLKRIRSVPVRLRYVFGGSLGAAPGYCAFSTYWTIMTKRIAHKSRGGALEGENDSMVCQKKV